MSRQRSNLVAEGRRLRNDVPLYQASDSEIQSDLKKLKYMKSVEPEPTPAIVKAELPKKRKVPIEDDRFVIEMLAKLQSIEKIDNKKKQTKVIEKKPEVPINKQSLYETQMMNILAIQNQYRAMLIQSQFGMFQMIQIKSSAEKHLKIAKFIQEHKKIR